ncbi:MAG: HigA family addiction module antidote protein [Bacteroidales bacterium]|nr:HigA family addiction module antidote protein [Bacteroidales bacterium]
MNHTMDNDSRITGFRAVHPGETLAEELKERGIKQKELAQAIGILPSHLNELIKGKRSFTTAIAMALEKELGIPYDFWMRLQYGYEHDCLVIAQREVEEQQRTRLNPPLLNKVATIL